MWSGIKLLFINQINLKTRLKKVLLGPVLKINNLNKMNSKIEARIEAVKLALNVEGVTSDNIIDVSTKIAYFILGDANLPDNNDPNTFMTDIMERLAPNPAIEAERLEREKKLTEMLTNLPVRKR